jgi:DNA modification methylase
MKIKKRKISELIKAEYNPRKITKVQEQDLKDSLQRFGLVDPIIININSERKNIVIGGHQRLKIWEELGNKEIDCNELDLTLDKERELNIRLNKNGGSFDDDLIQEYFNYEELTEWGFNPDELFDFKEDTIDGQIEDDEIPVAKESKVKRGDIWQLGDHRLMCGDSTSSDDLERLMNEKKADMVFTDPPWNVNYGAVSKNNPMGYKQRTILNDKMDTSDFKNFMNECFNNLFLYSKNGCPTYIVMSAQEWGNLMLSLKENNYHWSSTIIWNKDRLVLSRKDYHTKYEPIWYGWKEGEARLCSVKDRKQSDVWDIERPANSPLHPTTKPIELIEISIKNSSKKNNLILDIFMGSGSTLIACEKLQRKCYGMELDEKYCDVIIERWEQFTGKKAEKIN